mmetsp:Transcript_24501/g.51978  ORF Transcript_24501/g.51978 Transcript_24501/m.51978 type:complete len:89 (+) Transcript_24501:205-471(+)
MLVIFLVHQQVAANRADNLPRKHNEKNSSSTAKGPQRVRQIKAGIRYFRSHHRKDSTGTPYDSIFSSIIETKSNSPISCQKETPAKSK